MAASDLLKNIKGSLKSLSVLAAGISTLLPGLTYFSQYAPPMFTASALLSSGLGLAVFIRVFATDRKASTWVQRGSRSVVAAVFLASIYGLLFSLLTVSSPVDIPPPQRERYQIGFWTLDFSLTDEAKIKKKEYSLATPEELMLAFGGYEPGGTSQIWHTWTILSAGILLIALFILTFMLWAYGMALLAQSLSKT